MRNKDDLTIIEMPTSGRRNKKLSKAKKKGGAATAKEIKDHKDKDATTGTINDCCSEGSGARTKLRESLVWHILKATGPTSSSEEVEGTVDVIIDDLFESTTASTTLSEEEEEEEMSFSVMKGFLVDSLLEYFPDLQCDTTEVVENVIQYIAGRVDDYKEVRESESIGNNDVDEDSIASDSSDGNYIQDGECELCEREVKLTRHHLIPRSTWPRIKPRFLQAAPHFIGGDIKKAEEILKMVIPCGLSNDHVSSWRGIKLFLSHYTCNICRLCHSEVHRRFDNLELSERRNSVEALLEDEEIRKFCKWANKQRPQRR